MGIFAKKMEMTDAEVEYLRSVRPSLCYCASRAVGGWSPNMDALMNLGRQMAAALGEYRAHPSSGRSQGTISSRIKIGDLKIGDIKIKGSGKVIYTDFKNRRWISSSGDERSAP